MFGRPVSTPSPAADERKLTNQLCVCFGTMFIIIKMVLRHIRLSPNFSLLRRCVPVRVCVIHMCQINVRVSDDDDIVLLQPQHIICDLEQWPP